VTTATIRRKRRRLRERAAIWCSILAHDRALSAWTFKILEPVSPPALALAWKAWQAGTIENTHEMQHWRPGVSRDNASERWARAEAMLRTGWRPHA
jgi:hypothetical protein